MKTERKGIKGNKISEPGFYIDAYFDVVQIKKSRSGELKYCWIHFGNNIRRSFSFTYANDLTCLVGLGFKPVDSLFKLLYL